MQFINYLQYFFYLAHNWNIRIATHIISKEVKGEEKNMDSILLVQMS
jgi:hypothetical protein